MKPIYLNQTALQSAKAMPASFSDRTADSHFNPHPTIMELRELPADALVIPATHCEVDYDLRGIVFSDAPTVDASKKLILGYWSGQPPSEVSMVYFQNPHHEYFIDISCRDGHAQITDRSLSVLSENYVVRIDVPPMPLHSFLEVTVCINLAALKPSRMYQEGEGFDERNLDDISGETPVTFYLAATDIMASPDPTLVLIDALRYEWLDYGYCY